MNRVSRNWSSKPRVCGKFLPLLPRHKGCPGVPRGCQDEEMAGERAWASQLHVAVLLFPPLPPTVCCEAGGPHCPWLLSTVVLRLPLLCLQLFQMCSTWQEPL